MSECTRSAVHAATPTTRAGRPAPGGPEKAAEDERREERDTDHARLGAHLEQRGVGGCRVGVAAQRAVLRQGAGSPTGDRAGRPQRQRVAPQGLPGRVQGLQDPGGHGSRASEVHHGHCHRDDRHRPRSSTAHHARRAGRHDIRAIAASSGTATTKAALEELAAMTPSGPRGGEPEEPPSRTVRSEHSQSARVRSPERPPPHSRSRRRSVAWRGRRSRSRRGGASRSR